MMSSMTDDEIIEMAREAGFIGEWTPGFKQFGLFALDVSGREIEAALNKFAALVAAKEREECARVCERLGEDFYDSDQYAQAIRARNKLATNTGGTQ